MHRTTYTISTLLHKAIKRLAVKCLLLVYWLIYDWTINPWMVIIVVCQRGRVSACRDAHITILLSFTLFDLFYNFYYSLHSLYMYLHDFPSNGKSLNYFRKINIVSKKFNTKECYYRLNHWQNSPFLRMRLTCIAHVFNSIQFNNLLFYNAESVRISNIRYVSSLSLFLPSFTITCLFWPSCRTYSLRWQLFGSVVACQRYGAASHITVGNFHVSARFQHTDMRRHAGLAGNIATPAMI